MVLPAMTSESAQKEVEYVFLGRNFAVPPVAGCYMLANGGRSAIAINKVRQIRGDGPAGRLRLFGTPLKLRDLPVGVEPYPWPGKALTTVAPGPAEPPAPTDLSSIMTPTKRRTEERKRIVAMLRAERAWEDRPVENVRVANGTAEAAEWRDPSDLSVHRRVAKVVHGYRAACQLESMFREGRISQAHVCAGRRFHRDYVTGLDQSLPGKNLLEAANNGSCCSFGPNDRQMDAAQRHRETIAILRPHLAQIVMAVTIHEESCTAYGIRLGINRQVVQGRFLAALDFLADVYSEQDKAADGGGCA